MFFYKNLAKGAAKAAKPLVIKITNNPNTALEFVVEFSTAAATKNPKAITATAPFSNEFQSSRKRLVFKK